MDFHRGWRQRANELSETTKLFTLLGTYIHQQHGSRYYGKAMNITRRLIAAYDTVARPARPPADADDPDEGAADAEAGRAARGGRAAGARDDHATPRPSTSRITRPWPIPCGMSDGLPVSMMLVGKHWDEPTIYRAAAAFEGAGDWKTM